MRESDVISDESQITENRDRKKMRVFRFADAAELGSDTMPFVGVDETVMAGFSKLADVGLPRGLAEKTLLLFKEPGENGLSVAYAWFKSGYVLPRHSHDADCVYYVIAGSLTMGAVTLGKGDGVFIPADQGYTYEVGSEGVEVLEFRNAAKFHILFKGNDDAHFDRMADAMRDGASRWEHEPAPSDLLPKQISLINAIEAH
jgi:mannose-6-phosphate isomerase-like protein (cupin superfamily)